MLAGRGRDRNCGTRPSWFVFRLEPSPAPTHLLCPLTSCLGVLRASCAFSSSILSIYQLISLVAALARLFLSRALSGSNHKARFLHTSGSLPFAFCRKPLTPCAAVSAFCSLHSNNNCAVVYCILERSRATLKDRFFVDCYF